MYCSNCGKKLDDGEVCICEILGENPNPEANKPQNKNSSQRKIIVAIIAGVIACIISFLAVSVAVFVMYEKANEKNVAETSDVDIFEGIQGDFILEPSDTQYSKGKVSGNTYSNQWADLTVTLAPRFTEGTKEDYEEYSSILYDCGAYFVADDDGDDVSVLFYDAGNTTVREYAEESLDIWENSANEMVREIYSESFAKGITFRREARSVQIAGESYLAVFLIAETEGDALLVYGDFCAKKDGRIIDIGFSADSIEECLELAKQFKICNGQTI